MTICPYCASDEKIEERTTTFFCDACGYQWVKDGVPPQPERLDLSEYIRLLTAPDIKLAWLEKDVRIIHAVKQLLWKDGVATIPPLDIESVEQIAGIPAVSQTRHPELGFGGLHLQWALYGGYATCWITLLVFEGQIALFHLAHGSTSKQTELLPVYQRVWSVEPNKKGQIVIEIRDEPVFERWHAAVKAQLGAVEIQYITKDLKSAYELLTSPIHTYDYGTRCYYAASKPAGRTAIETLLGQLRVDLIRSALRGLNPVGRVYAASALLRLKGLGMPLTDDDAVVIEKIRALPIKISTCSGCIVSDSTASHLLPSVEKGYPPIWLDL